MASQILKRVMSLLGISLATLLGACGKNPTPRDIIGTWANADGAELMVEENGQFTAHALPQATFWRRDQPGPAFDGKGTWKLQKGAPYWELKLWFREISGQSANREITVLVSGGGLSTYLYRWKGEEGEDQYKLERRSVPPH
jgi:hypothetical protein